MSVSVAYSSFGIGVDRKNKAKCRFHQENGTSRCSQKVHGNSETALDTVLKPFLSRLCPLICGLQRRRIASKHHSARKGAETHAHCETDLAQDHLSPPGRVVT